MQSNRYNCIHAKNGFQIRINFDNKQLLIWKVGTIVCNKDGLRYSKFLKHTVHTKCVSHWKF